MVKIVDITQLVGGITSFRTEIDSVDTKPTLQERYEHYKNLGNGGASGSSEIAPTTETAANTE